MELKGPEEAVVETEVSYNVVVEPHVEAEFQWQLFPEGQAGEREELFAIKKAKGPSFTVVFKAPGTYKLVVSITSPEGSARSERTITVKEASKKPPTQKGMAPPPSQEKGEASVEVPQAPTVFAVGKEFSLMAAGDVTGDGRADLILGRTDSPNVALLAGEGDGHFRNLGSFSVGILPERLLAADLTGNSLADVIAINWSKRMASLLIAVRGRLLPPRPLWLPNGAWDVVVDQLNDNPGLELVWLTHSGPRVWSFSTNGSLIEWAKPPKGLSFVMVAPPPYVWADMDSDGEQELVFYSANPGEIEMMKLGTESPITLAVTPTGHPLDQIDAADVDGDGITDLLGLDSSGNLYVWFLSDKR